MDKLDLILEKLEQMDARQQRFEERQGKFEERQGKFEERQEKFEERQQKFEERLDRFEQRLDNLDAGLKELFQLTKAIIHRQEMTDAKLEALTLDVHKIYGMMVSFQASQERQDKILEMLSLRSLEQEGEIRDLRRAIYSKSDLS